MDGYFFAVSEDYIIQKLYGFGVNSLVLECLLKENNAFCKMF